jgi:hypothetical protein
MSVLLVACGALAREVIAIRDRHEWDAKVLALPALLHNEPSRIPAAVKARIEAVRVPEQYDNVIVVYGDCGTGGLLDAMLAGIQVERIAGPHCYEQYAGKDGYNAMMDEAPGTFFLTDYMVQSFDHLVIEGLGLDRYPELLDMYFGNYQRVVYLQQRDDATLREWAAVAANQLGLPLEIRFTGYGALENRLLEKMNSLQA